MPLCDGKPIYHQQRGWLGICAACAIDVVDHFNRLGEVPELTERKMQRELRNMQLDRQAADRMGSRAIEPGWVYYLRVGDRIKIGYSTDVKQRMKSYPPGSKLLAVHPGTKTLEAQMHDKFSQCRASGREWFYETPELTSHMGETVAQFGSPDRFAYSYRSETTPLRPHRRSRH